MMTVTEKAAYLKGLAEGLNLEDSKEAKLINAIIDVIDDMALTIADLEDDLALVSEQVDAVDEDLDELETFVYDDEDDYDDFDDCDCDCGCCDEECYEIDCPSCGETICVDEGIIEDGSIECPSCGTLLEFDFDEEDDEEE